MPLAHRQLVKTVVTALVLSALAVAVLAVSTAPVKAKSIISCDRFGCSDRGHVRTAHRHHARVRSAIVSHPTGCPARAFCGCGVSVKAFGHPVRSLFLASNWLRFPRTSCASGMVAARSGHAMYIMACHGNSEATVYDPNSGGHRTRIHVRSLRGFAIVNPYVSTFHARSRQ